MGLLAKIMKSVKREPSDEEKHEMEWAGYCSFHKTLCPCTLEHPSGVQHRLIPFRIRPRWNEDRYQGYELRDMYGDDFPLFRDELPPLGWEPKPKPVKLAERYVFSDSNPTRARLEHVERGSDGLPNAWGTVLVEQFRSETPDITLRTLPVTCGHGGSMWLCSSCASELKQRYNNAQKRGIA